MKMALRIYDTKTNNYVENDHAFLMTYAGLDARMDFEDFGIQSDGTLVVFDKCGNFGYLNESRFKLVIMSDE